MEKLYGLVYTSKRERNCSDAEIKKILDACNKNNPGKNITGVLLYNESTFIQYLEGSKDIIELYDLIKTDPRHKQIFLLSYGPIKERSFPNWHMGCKQINNDTIDFDTTISNEEKTIFNNIILGKNIETDRGIQLIKKFFLKVA